jgi:hypothetical protein
MFTQVKEMANVGRDLVVNVPKFQTPDLVLGSEFPDLRNQNGTEFHCRMLLRFVASAALSKTKTVSMTKEWVRSFCICFPFRSLGAHSDPDILEFIQIHSDFLEFRFHIFPRFLGSKREPLSRRAARSFAELPRGRARRRRGPSDKLCFFIQISPYHHH